LLPISPSPSWRMKAVSSFDELARPDVIVVPGGPGTRAAMSGRRLLR
jgi:putative intracellular protease/amidase